MNQPLKHIIKLRAAPVVDIDIFGGNPLDNNYFRTSFRDIMKSHVEDQRVRFTRLIKYTSWDAKELIK